MICEAITILFVEDNPDHAELVLRSLGGHLVPNRIIHVPDGEAALHYLKRAGKYSDPKESPRPDLVLMDLRLPKFDGLEVLEQIKASEELRPIPVVILTTSDTESDIARAYQLHANSYLVKPTDYAKFSKLMEDLGFYWMAWNRSKR